MKVQSIYSSNILKKGLEFAAENGTLFAATASLAFSTVRPLIILAAPDTDKKNKQIASTKAIASTVIGYAMMCALSLPVAKAVKNIDMHPAKFLKKSTMAFLQNGEKSLGGASRYSFSTQLLKLGLGALAAVPKSILTCALIPPIMACLFNNKNKDRPSTIDKNINFTGLYQNNLKGLINHIGNLPRKGIEALSSGFGKIIDSKTVKKLADKFHDTKFEQHIISLTDILATGAFIAQTAKSDKLKENDKKLLIYNSIISTGFSIAGMYAIDSLTKKPTEQFVENFKRANANSPKLDKYLEGIRIVKPLMILGTLYYVVIPLLSVFCADKFVRSKNK